MKHIAIIDDSPSVVRCAKVALESAGYRVSGYSDPSWLDPTGGEKPDLVLVDVNMQEFFGDDVVRYLKDVWAVDVPVYLFSALAEDELKQHTVDCGADGYVTKGSGSDLIAAVSAILDRARAAPCP
jgi:DNA-binding response OmpR family regulator